MKKFLTLGFIPISADAALLMLRLWFGLALLINHGWGKLMTFEERAAKFPDPLGVGATTSLVLAIIGEVVCSVLIVLGLTTRLAALGSATTMLVAFWKIHGGRLQGANNGELAFVFLGGFVVLLIAGAGRFSLDRKLLGGA